MASSSAVRIRKQMRPSHQHFACNIRGALEELEVSPRPEGGPRNTGTITTSDGEHADPI